MEGWPTQAEWRGWLYEHAPKFLLFARQKARCDADAQDLMQEAIIEVAQRNAWNGPPAPALVFATIHRRAIDWARREDRRTAREHSAFDPQAGSWFDTGLEERERAGLIQDAITKLPELQREVIVLKIWGGLTFAEIADLLQIPPNTAASRYRYGLEELRKLTKEVFT